MGLNALKYNPECIIQYQFPLWKKKVYFREQCDMKSESYVENQCPEVEAGLTSGRVCDEVT